MSSFVCLCCHIVFSTKSRLHVITPDIRPRLWGYLGGILREQGGVALAVGGTDNHVHLLASLDKKAVVPDVVRGLKTNSSRWVHETFGRPMFGWQEGYAAFSVGVRSVPQVQAYIRNQDDHHREATFEEEFAAFLQQHGVVYDERFLWG